MSDLPNWTDRFFKISEAAAILGLNAATIRRWIRRGRIRTYGFRGARYVRPCDLLPPVTCDPMPKSRGKQGT